MENVKNYSYYLDQLRDSVMFHMSLGSKELFHSNFLHWISVVDGWWDAFLSIMHGLADTDKFWWESEKVKDYKGNPYHPNNKNIKVFREHRNFDLSIYILDSEKDAKDGSNNDKVADNDNTSEYTYDSIGKRKVQKWIPVLVLENKMKSLPYKAQLEEYTQKAFEEWRKGEILIKPEIKTLKQNVKNEKIIVPQDWVTDHGITFILLSLMDTDINNYSIGQPLAYTKDKNACSLIFRFDWAHATYSKLVGIVEKLSFSTSSSTDLKHLVLDDYKVFLNALCGLAHVWEIKFDSKYRSQIAPWKINNNEAKNTIYEIEKYKELRIHDIHEKIMYNQLLNQLEKKLEDDGMGFERYNAKTNQKDFEDKDRKIRIFTDQNYAHGIGIFEVHYFLFKKNNRPSDKEAFFKLIIQVQGDRYCHMVVNDGIVDEKNGSLGVDENALVWESLKPIRDTLGKYISINGSQPEFPWESEPSWGKYGNNLIYQYVEIPQTVTIQEVINAIIKDLQMIRNWI